MDKGTNTKKKLIVMDEGSVFLKIKIVPNFHIL